MPNRCEIFHVEPILRHRPGYGSETPEHLAGYGCWLAWHLPRRAGRSAVTLLLAGALAAAGLQQGCTTPDHSATVGVTVVLDPVAEAQGWDGQVYTHIAERQAAAIMNGEWLRRWTEQHPGETPVLFFAAGYNHGREPFNTSRFNDMLGTWLMKAGGIEERVSWSSFPPSPDGQPLPDTERLAQALERAKEQNASFLLITEAQVVSAPNREGQAGTEYRWVARVISVESGSTVFSAEQVIRKEPTP